MLAAFTLLHVVISLIAIGSGLVVAWGLLTANRLNLWTAVFLATTVLTSVTGFFFPVDRFLPSHAIGILSLLVLGLAIAARYRFHLAGLWRMTYVISAVFAFYLNFFVLIVQSFLKVRALTALAPTQTEPPFLAAQSIALVLFVAIAIGGVMRFRGAPIAAGHA